MSENDRKTIAYNLAMLILTMANRDPDTASHEERKDVQTAMQVLAEQFLFDVNRIADALEVIADNTKKPLVPGTRYTGPNESAKKGGDRQ